MRARWVLAWSCLIAAGCDGSVMPEDAGTRDAGPDTGNVEVCDRDQVCDDGRFCNGTERCMPGAAGADARGCVVGPNPCLADQVCVEDEERCQSDDCADGGDADGDGENRPGCGGSDCDDSDATRYPGNTEECDPESHDEDCNPATFGDTDGDGDGFVSAACCNGANCGNDCNDGDINVNPGATETCNGVDDDCESTIDLSTGSLCPGGLCTAGRCAFDAWDTTFGTASDDVASSVAMDGAGNVYVAGSVRAGSVDFGGGLRTVPESRAAVFVVKLAPDGRYLWDYVGPAMSRALVTGIAVDGPGSRIYVVGRAVGNLGSGDADAPFVLRLGSDGAYVLDRRFGGTFDLLNDVALTASGAITIGKFWQTVDFGGGAVDLGSSETMVVLPLAEDGGYAGQFVFPAVDGNSVGSSLAVSTSGSIAVAGTFSGTLTLGDELVGRGAFVAQLDRDGVPMWAHAVRSTGSTGTQALNSVAFGPLGMVYAAGQYTGSVDPGIGTPFFSSSGTNALVIALHPDGSPRWARSLGANGGQDGASDVAVTLSGDVAVVGEFSTTTDFGRGPRVPVSRDGFLATYGPDGAPIRDVVYSSAPTRVSSIAIGPGSSTVIVGIFSGTSNFGSGSRVSYGGFDAFVLRLGS